MVSVHRGLGAALLAGSCLSVSSGDGTADDCSPGQQRTSWLGLEDMLLGWLRHGAGWQAGAGRLQEGLGPPHTDLTIGLLGRLHDVAADFLQHQQRESKGKRPCLL